MRSRCQGELLLKIARARWQNGYAADCKSVDLGSTPGRASIKLRFSVMFIRKCARVVESVDTRDLKSLAGNSVPVQVWPRVPFLIKKYFTIKYSFARVVESVDTRDLKSLAGNSVPVQVWPRVPLFISKKC